MSRSIPSASITIGAAQLSDLFFNHDLTNRAALYQANSAGLVGRAGNQVDPAVERAALERDAEEFMDCLAGCYRPEDRAALVAWLVADFEARV